MLEKLKGFLFGNRSDKGSLAVFLPLIEQGDPVAVSLARDLVTDAHIAPLVAHYWTLDSWEQKLAVVELLQDQSHPSLPKLMLDFLRAPDSQQDERIELGKAVALRYFAEKYDRFMTYYNDRDLLARDVVEVLEANGMSLVEDVFEVKESADSLPQQSPSKLDLNKSLEEQLMDAAIAGELEVVESAVSHGANVNIEMDGGDFDGCSPLIMALMNKRFDVAELLIENGASVHHTRPGHTKNPAIGQTPIWWVGARGTIRVGKMLLERGADVNVPDHHGGTALTSAADNGRLEMVKFLVENGADIHAQIYDKRTAFNLACNNGHTAVIAYLLSQGSDPNQAGSSGYMPLMVAAENNYYELAKLLIDAGADINGIHKGGGIYIYYRGWTPLAFALNAGYVRMTKLLVQSGADIQYQVPAGRDYKGQRLPKRGMMAMVGKKRTESLQKILRQAGLES